LLNQRLKSIEVRKELTDEWQERDLEEQIGESVVTNKNFKNLKSRKTQITIPDTKNLYEAIAKKAYRLRIPFPEIPEYIL